MSQGLEFLSSPEALASHTMIVGGIIGLEAAHYVLRNQKSFAMGLEGTKKIEAAALMACSIAALGAASGFIIRKITEKYTIHQIPFEALGTIADLIAFNVIFKINKA